MAWIEQVPEDRATGKLAKIYEMAKGRAGRVANILKIMSLRPGPLSTFMRLYVQLMKEESTISFADREMVAAVTSEVNGCFY